MIYVMYLKNNYNLPKEVEILLTKPQQKNAIF